MHFWWPENTPNKSLILRQISGLLYHFVKILGRLAIHIFCRKISINDKTWLTQKGPILIAANHPNSFLDSIIVDILFDEPVHSLARGDVFKKPTYAKLLRALHILPVYRTSEGVENLSTNYKTFNDCIELFKKNGIVTIYSEGLCVNEWHLRPLKKGTARLAIQAWDENIPLRVLPVSLNYSSFFSFGKNVVIRFGKPICKEDVPLNGSDGTRNIAFNKILQEELAKGVFEIPPTDSAKHQELLQIKTSLAAKILLFIPGILGWLLHQPLYSPLMRFAKRKTKGTGHFDSVIIAMLLLTYPIYLTLIAVLVGFTTGSFWGGFSIYAVMPALAWCYVKIKKQSI